MWSEDVNHVLERCAVAGEADEAFSVLGNIFSMHGNQERATATAVFFGTFSVPFRTQSLVFRLVQKPGHVSAFQI